MLNGWGKNISGLCFLYCGPRTSHIYSIIFVPIGRLRVSMSSMLKLGKTHTLLGLVVGSMFTSNSVMNTCMLISLSLFFCARCAQWICSIRSRP